MTRGRHPKDTPYRVGDLYLVKRKDTGSWSICGRTSDGCRLRRSTQTDDLGKAKRTLDDFVLEIESGWREASSQFDDWVRVAKKVVRRQEASARVRGIPFLIDSKHVFQLMKSTNFCCAVSGIAFSRTIIIAGEPDPWAPSIDRIENRQGYTRDNTRVVSLAANIAMNRWGYDTLLRLAKGVTASALLVAVEVPGILADSRHTYSSAARKTI